MINRRLVLANLGLLCGSMLMGCELIDAHRDIYGKWRAEQLSFGGVGLPIGPELEFTREKAVVNGNAVSVQGYEMSASTITVHVSDGPSMTFEMIDKNTMTIAFPVIGKVRYRKLAS